MRSTNVFLRRLHNFCLDMNWLPWPIIPKRQWPPVRHKDKRAVTLEEHLAIVAREQNLERRAYYELPWHIGASQSDIAGLQAEDIDWEDRFISYARKKTKQVARVRFGEEVEIVLRTLPKQGPLFPYLMGSQQPIQRLTTGIGLKLTTPLNPFSQSAPTTHAVTMGRMTGRAK